MNDTLTLRRALTLVLLLTLTSCTNESNQKQPVTTTTGASTSNAPAATEVKQRGNVLVRVIHALPAGPSADLFADDVKIFPDLNYKTISSYKELSAERHTFRIRTAGLDASQPLAITDKSLVDGRHYTLVAMQDADETPTLYMLNDDLVPPTAGKARVRVIHVSPDVGEVNLFAQEGGKRLFERVNAFQETDYSEFDPFNGNVEVRPYVKANVAVTIPNVRFEADRIYTIVLVGKAKGSPKLEGLIIADELRATIDTQAGKDPSANANARDANK